MSQLGSKGPHRERRGSFRNTTWLSERGAKTRPGTQKHNTQPSLTLCLGAASRPACLQFCSVSFANTRGCRLTTCKSSLRTFESFYSVKRFSKWQKNNLLKKSMLLRHCVLCRKTKPLNIIYSENNRTTTLKEILIHLGCITPVLLGIRDSLHSVSLSAGSISLIENPFLLLT